jgi:hypothetical protein
MEASARWRRRAAVSRSCGCASGSARTSGAASGRRSRTCATGVADWLLQFEVALFSFGDCALSANVAGALFLVCRGTDVDAADASGRPPLQLFAELGLLALCELLLEHGADANVQAENARFPTALLVALASHPAEVGAALLDGGEAADGPADQNQDGYEDGAPKGNGPRECGGAPLLFCVAASALLVERGARLDVRNAKGETKRSKDQGRGEEGSEGREEGRGRERRT